MVGIGLGGLGLVGAVYNLHTLFRRTVLKDMVCFKNIVVEFYAVIIG